MRLSLAVLVSGSMPIAGCGGGEEQGSEQDSASAKATATATETPTPAADGPSKKERRAKVLALRRRDQKAAEKVAADAYAEGLRGKALIKATFERSFRATRRYLNELGEVQAPVRVRARTEGLPARSELSGRQAA